MLEAIASLTLIYLSIMIWLKCITTFEANLTACDRGGSYWILTLVVMKNLNCFGEVVGSSPLYYVSPRSEPNLGKSYEACLKRESDGEKSFRLLITVAIANLNILDEAAASFTLCVLSPGSRPNSTISLDISLKEYAREPSSWFLIVLDMKSLQCKHGATPTFALCYQLPLSQPNTMTIFETILRERYGGVSLFSLIRLIIANINLLGATVTTFLLGFLSLMGWIESITDFEIFSKDYDEGVSVWLIIILTWTNLNCIVEAGTGFIFSWVSPETQLTIVNFQTNLSKHHRGSSFCYITTTPSRNLNWFAWISASFVVLFLLRRSQLKSLISLEISSKEGEQRVSFWAKSILVVTTLEYTFEDALGLCYLFPGRQLWSITGFVVSFYKHDAAVSLWLSAILVTTSLNWTGEVIANFIWFYLLARTYPQSTKLASGLTGWEQGDSALLFAISLMKSSSYIDCSDRIPTFYLLLSSQLESCTGILIVWSVHDAVVSFRNWGGLVMINLRYLIEVPGSFTSCYPSPRSHLESCAGFNTSLKGHEGVSLCFLMIPYTAFASFISCLPWSGLVARSITGADTSLCKGDYFWPSAIWLTVNLNYIGEAVAIFPICNLIYRNLPKSVTRSVTCWKDRDERLSLPVLTLLVMKIVKYITESATVCGECHLPWEN